MNGFDQWVGTLNPPAQLLILGLLVIVVAFVVGAAGAFILSVVFK